jgi:hypothetical protein
MIASSAMMIAATSAGDRAIAFGKDPRGSVHSGLGDPGRTPCRGKRTRKNKKKTLSVMKDQRFSAGAELLEDPCTTLDIDAELSM